MESASFRVAQQQTLIPKKCYNGNYTRLWNQQAYCYQIPRTHLYSYSPFSLPSLNFSFRTKNSQFCGSSIRASSAQSGGIVDGGQPEQPPAAVLLEVEGVLMDIYRSGNLKAFNLAFRKLGLDCANWTEPVYSDLIRRSAGDEEKMLAIYFNRIGWPTSVPTNEKGAFVKNVMRHKKDALNELVMSKTLSLRPGVEDFIDDACKEGVPVVILSAYCKMGEQVARSVIEKLGDDRMSKIKVIGKTEVEKSMYGQLVLGKGVSSSLDEQLAKEVAKAASAEKQRIAEEVASMLKLRVDIDTSSSESLQYVVATLRAGAEFAEVPLYKCVLVAGGQLGVSGAERISMPCVVLRSSFTARAEFPSANSVLDGFGGTDLTISRLQKLVQNSQRT
ncbi:OLC1v1025241C1 [Oldenlandia corymbosa var. corymbosa]|uniref:OLC1v1025241C1 n=1 Tax=Oldenlandia corymbosa var. corymbosa TaxID=529605 RepID=A0AAV1C4B8_OLDCO|nr:OLC1v1025241C1 [Oldenlandia corymbosa var. corymbosa]